MSALHQHVFSEYRQFWIYFGLLIAFLAAGGIASRAPDWWKDLIKPGISWLREARLHKWLFYQSGHGRHHLMT